MKRTGCIVAAALSLGLPLAGITGYFMWYSGQDKYVRAKMVGASEGMSIASAEGPIPEETGGAGGVTNPDSVQGTNSPDTVDGGLSDAPNDVKGQDPETGIEDRDPPLQFVFTGDILLSNRVSNAYQKAGNIGGVVDGGFRQVIDASNVFVINEELPFSRHGTVAANKQLILRLSPEKVSMFQELGIDIVTPAGSHTLDFGTDVLLDACSILDDVGILRVGVGVSLEETKKPAFMEAKDRKIGFLDASRVIPEGSWNAASKGPGILTTYNPSLLLEEIKKAREACDRPVTYVHWGIERDRRPWEYQRILGQRYIDAGADLVVGNRPRVVQGLEYYKGKSIAYSPGNFVFGSSIPKTAPLEVEWDGEDVLPRLVPGTSSGGCTKMLTDKGGKAGFYRYVISISYGVAAGEDGIVAPGEEDAAGQEGFGI